jgi:hypothetical protein
VFRIRRLEREAREALAAGAPFQALALCDRGLAYDPDHAGLLAVVAEAETSTARPALRPRRRWIAAAMAVAVAAVLAVVALRLRSPSSDGAPAGDDPWATTSTTPTAMPKPTVTTTVTTGITEDDRALVGDFLSVFGRAVDAGEQAKAAGSGSNGKAQMDPALARDMLGLFGKVLRAADKKAPPP